MTPKKFHKTISLLVITASFLVFVGIFYSWKMIKDLSRRVYEKEVYLNNFTNKVNVLSNLKRNYEKNLGNMNNILYSFPKEKKADVFMVDLESIAMETGVKLSVYKYFVLPTKIKKKADIPSDLNLTQTVKQKDYYEVPLQISAEGEYPKVLSFLKKVEGLRRLNNMKNLEFVKIKDEDKPPDYVKLVSDISIYFKE